MARRFVAAVIAMSFVSPPCVSASSHQSTDALNQASAAKWEGKSVTVRLVDDRLVSGRVIAVEGDALVLRGSQGKVERVRFAIVAAIGPSHWGPQIFVAIAAVVILVGGLVLPRLAM